MTEPMSTADLKANAAALDLHAEQVIEVYRKLSALKGPDQAGADLTAWLAGPDWPQIDLAAVASVLVQRIAQ